MKFIEIMNKIFPHWMRYQREEFRSMIVHRSAFSLMELLVVVAMMTLLIGVSLPAVTQTLRHSNLSSAGQSIVDQLNMARQTSLSRNLPVEVRFYKLPDYADAATSTPSVYRALQFFLKEDAIVVPLTKVIYFSRPVICSPDLAQSSLMDPNPPYLMTEQAPVSSDPNFSKLPIYGMNYKYRSFYFRPDGSTSLPGNANIFVTLVMENGKSLEQGANFVTVQINSTTARPHVFRP